APRGAGRTSSFIPGFVARSELPRMSPAPLTENLTRTLWPSFKRRLATKFPSEEWVRCLYLLRAIPVGPSQVYLLATLPPSGAIMAGALNRLPEMRRMLAPSFSLSLCKKPDAWELAEISRRFGLDYAPKWGKGE